MGRYTRIGTTLDIGEWVPPEVPRLMESQGRHWNQRPRVDLQVKMPQVDKDIRNASGGPGLKDIPNRWGAQKASDTVQVELGQV